MFFSLLADCIFAFSSYGQNRLFLSDVSTNRKPWTNLNFNNHPQNFQFDIISVRNGGNRLGIFEDDIKKLNLMQPEFVINI